VFDFRVGQPGSAAANLTLVYNTFKELKAAGKSADAVVVFIGPSVKLISTARDGFNADEKKTLDDIARTVTAMSKDGIRLEICMVAAKVFNVDPATVLPEIRKVPNGWVSLIELQNQGYSLVPAY
jgi:intracellular sulfur oxidation DsrE/DsrF family protein